MWIAIGVACWVAASVVVMMLVGRGVALADDLERRARRHTEVGRPVGSPPRSRVVALRPR
jgi:hypothetical protein